MQPLLKGSTVELHPNAVKSEVWNNYGGNGFDRSSEENTEAESVYSDNDLLFQQVG